jgi:hydroxyacylglutathione hydrolase
MSVSPLQHVHRIDIFGSNVFLLETDSLLFCIDAGYPGQPGKVLKKIQETGKPLKLILLTHGHFDHYGSAAEIRRQTGAMIAIHKNDADNLRFGRTPIDSVKGRGYLGRIFLPLGELVLRPDTVSADILLSDGDSLDDYGLRATVVHTSGHTHGSCCFIVEDSIVFAGDLLVSTPRSVDKQIYFAQSWRAIDKSLCTLCNRQFKLVYIGHTGKTVSREFVLDLCRKIKRNLSNEQ